MKKRAKRNLSVYIRLLSPIRASALTLFVKANLTERERNKGERDKPPKGITSSYNRDKRDNRDKRANTPY
jgi:hypothetical protein